MSIMDIAGASAASGGDRSMTEPEERGAGWGMHAGFVGNADAKASSDTAFGNA